MVHTKIKDFDEYCNQLRDEVLPSGSGFDYDWDISHSKDGKKLHCETAYHHMDGDTGMYDAIVDFAVDIPVRNPMAFEVKLTGDEAINRFARKDQLPEYIEDVMADRISENAKIIKDGAKSIREDCKRKSIVR